MHISGGTGCSRLLRSIQYIFAWRRCSRFLMQMGRSFSFVNPSGTLARYSGKLVTRCVHVGLITTKLVLALYEQEVEQHNSQPSYQTLKTTVERCLDQKIRARNFEARNERIEERQRKAKGNQSALNGSKENDENKGGKSTRSSSPAPEPQTKNDETNSSKGESLRGQSPVIHGILPCVRITNRIGLQSW